MLRAAPCAGVSPAATRTSCEPAQRLLQCMPRVGAQRHGSTQPPPPPAACPANTGARAAGSGRARLRCHSSSDGSGGGASSEGPVGVVVVDHGSKKAEANDALLEFAELYK